MTDTEKKKLSPEQEKQRDKINFLIEKADKSGLGVTKLMESLGKKAYYFRHVVAIPLKEEFKSFIKSQFRVDLDKEIENKAPMDLTEQEKEWMAEKNRLLLKIDQLQDKLIDISEKKLESLDDATREIITLNAEVRELRRKIDGK